jgi:hypothetical protein
MADATQSPTARGMKAKKNVRGSVTLRELARVNGTWPATRVENADIPTKPKTSAHQGVLRKVNLRHVSARRPVIAQTGGKSFAASWDPAILTFAI